MSVTIIRPPNFERKSPFSGRFNASYSKQNGKIESRKTLENRAAAAALLRTPQWGS
jgi:hypothetical protein